MRAEAQRRADRTRYLKLLPLHEVRSRITTCLGNRVCPTESIRADAALGRVAAQTIRSLKDVPEVQVAAMDGYAVSHSSLLGASATRPASFRVKGELDPSDRSTLHRASIGSGESYQVATGGPLPRGSDLVVRSEDVKLVTPRKIQVFRTFPRSSNVSAVGEDMRRGDELIRKHSIAGAADVATLISSGRSLLKVYRTPKIGVLSVGDELTEFEGRTRRKGTFNNYSNLVRGYLQLVGIETRSLGVCGDSPDEITSRLERAIDDFDVVCTIAGSSVGYADLLPDAAVALRGSELVFHGVRVVPIRPAGLVAVHRGRRIKLVIILPGHAVSAAAATFLIALPSINLVSGLAFDARRAMIRGLTMGAFENNRPMDAVALAEVRWSDGLGYAAAPLPWGSNILSNLSRAAAFALLKPRQTVDTGRHIDLHVIDWSVIRETGAAN